MGFICITVLVLGTTMAGVTASAEEIRLDYVPPAAHPPNRSISRQQSEMTHRTWRWKQPDERWSVKVVKK